MRARNHSITGRFTPSTAADNLGAFGKEHRRRERQKENVITMRATLKRHGATDEQLDKTIPVMVEKPIDDLPAGMIRGLEPALAVELCRAGAVRFLWKPVESQPPEFVMRALQEIGEAEAEAGRMPEWMLRLMADTGRARGVPEAEIEARLDELRKDAERHREPLEPAVDEEEDEDEGEGQPAGDAPRSALGPLSDDDAIALVKASADVGEIEKWLDLEQSGKEPRKAVIDALEARIDELLEVPAAPGTSTANVPPPPAPTVPPPPKTTPASPGRRSRR